MPPEWGANDAEFPMDDLPRVAVAAYWWQCATQPPADADRLDAAAGRECRDGEGLRPGFAEFWDRFGAGAAGASGG